MPSAGPTRHNYGTALDYVLRLSQYKLCMWVCHVLLQGDSCSHGHALLAFGTPR